MKRMVGAGLRRAAMAVAVCALTATAARAELEVALQPQRIALGESARLIVQRSGQGAGEQPRLPAIDGLQFVPGGTQTSVRIINGSVQASESWTFWVRPLRTGRFTIDPAAIEVGGEHGSGAPLVLEVGASPQGTPPGSGSGTSRAGTASPSTPTPGGAGTGLEGVPASLRPFVVVRPRKQQLVVGESVPVEVEAWFPASIAGQLQSAPTAEGSAFALAGADAKAHQSRRRLDGRLYNVLRWELGLTALKAGRYPLEIGLDAVLDLPVQRRRRPRRRRSPFANLRRPGSPFDDPFFDDFFDDPMFNSLLDDVFARTERRKVHIASEPLEIEVKPLPAEGRPDAFTGAVGNFEIEARAEPRRVTEGEPITVRIEIRGRGSFDRLGTPRFTGDENAWSVYPGDSRFEAAGPSQIEGKQVLEVTVLPRKAGLHEIPPFEIAYFDPDLGRYVRRATDPIPVEVRPAPDTPAQASAANGEAGSAADDEAASPGGKAEATPRDLVREPDGWWRSDAPPAAGIDTLTLPWRNRTTQRIAAALFAVLALGVGATVRRRQLERDPVRARVRAAEREVRRLRRAARRAAAAGDARGVIEAGARAVRLRLAARWDRDPQTLTTGEIEARLGSLPEEVAALLRAADAASYAGARPGAQQAQTWWQRVERALQALEGQR